MPGLIAKGTLFFLALLTVATIATAEEKLKKNAAEYLGWQTGKDEFTTCGKTKMPIGNGKIDKTGDKCPKDRGPSASAVPSTFLGTVVALDTQQRTVSVMNAKGEISKFFIPKAAESAGRRLDDLKLGDHLILSVPVEGRANFPTSYAARDDKRNDPSD